MSTAPLVFTGVSTYSNDFQTILQRAVSIAQLPIKRLQNTQTDNLNKKQALVGLDPAVANLASAVAALGTVATNQGLVASSSNSSIVSVVNTGTSAPATHTVSNIQTLATAASETSILGYANSSSTPVSTAGQNKVDLVVGAAPAYHLDLTGKNNLVGLRDAINNSGAPVTASILTTGSNNYLSISANNPGVTTLTLTDVAADPANSVSLITNNNQGSNADFMLDGIHITSKKSNVINDVIPGVSFTLQNTTNGSVKLSLATDATQLSTALGNFTHAYNALVDQTNQQIGQSAGPLAGNVLIRDISDDLRQLSSYWNTSGSIRSLSDLGVTFDTTGHMSFDQSVFSGLSGSQVSDAFKFLGSSQSGFAAFANNFTQLSDPATGLIRIEEDGLDKENTQLTSQISVLEDRVNRVQASMTAKLQAADALVAELQSQQNTLNASIQSINYVTYGKVTNANGQ